MLVCLKFLDMNKKSQFINIVKSRKFVKFFPLVR